MNILVTGGAGYIGSHTVLELLQNNHKVIVVDNLSNSSREAIRRIEKISSKSIKFYDFDIRENNKLSKLFNRNKIDAVVHFAGLKSVSESVENPLNYYDNNLVSTISLLNCMDVFGVKKLIFSSSATVYGHPEMLPIKESHPFGPTNPYGRTKLIIEQMLNDLSNSNKGWNITSLRYFNPIGAHSSGDIGEDPNGKPNNLLPFVAQVAIGRLSYVSIFGNDYDTADGTGVRDYIHVVDLARAHVAALNNLEHPNIYKAFNVGTGSASSVLDIIHAFEKTTGKKIPYVINGRRPGDVASCYADVSLAKKELGWSATLTVQDGCNSTWMWQTNNPHGYRLLK